MVNDSQNLQPENATALPQKIGRYVVKNEIASGATAVVYSAEALGQPTAVKLMKESVAGGAAVDLALRFRREAAIMARLKHSALVTVNELGEFDGRPFLAMELVQGRSLAHLLAEKPLPVDAVLELAIELAGALGEVHRYGLVHRDIKPQNIMMSSDGRVKLIDFGLATTIAVGDGETSESAVGTLLYASPEQLGVIQRGLDGRADLYGLGATLYHALTGQPPLQADTVGELFQKLGVSVPPDIRTLRPEVRPVFAAVVGKLLAKDPDDRYQTATGLLWDLENFAELERVGDGAQDVVLGSHDSRGRIVGCEVALCGRSTELKTIQRAWDAAKQGETQVIQVEGESGLGKSRLIRELVSVAGAEGAVILAGKCEEQERVPLGPIRAAIDSLLTRAPGVPEAEHAAVVERVRLAASEHAAVLKRLSRGLAQVIDLVPETPKRAAEDERTLFIDCTASFIRALMKSAPGGVLVLDDVQWIDEMTVALVHRLCAEDAAAPLLIATTARNDPKNIAASDHFVRAVGEAHVLRVALRPLNASAVAEMVGLLLGGPIKADTHDAVRRLTRGNPFVVSEYARVLVEQALAWPGTDHWEFDPRALSKDVLPQDVIDLVVTRFEALHPNTQEMLSLAALIGNRADGEILSRAMNLSKAVVESHLDEAVRATLVERAGDASYVFTHDQIRVAAMERIGSERLPDLHERVAMALAANPSQSAEYVYGVARHFSLGHPERHAQEVFESASAACDLALRTLDYDATYHFAKIALSAASADTPTAQRMRLFESLGNACNWSGRLEEAPVFLREAEELAATPEERFRVQHAMAYTEISLGTRSWQHIERAFDLLGKPLPRTKLAMGISTVWYLLRFAVRRWLGWGFDSAKGAQRESRIRLSQIHQSAMIQAIFEIDKNRVPFFVARELYNAHFLGVCEESATSFAVAGNLLAYSFMPGPAERIGARSLEQSEQLGNLGVTALNAFRLEQSRHIRGEVDVAAMFKWADVASRVLPGAQQLCSVFVEHMTTLFFLGQTRTLDDYIKKTREYVEPTHAACLIYGVYLLNYLHLVQMGRHEQAQEFFTRAEEIRGRHDNWVMYMDTFKSVFDMLLINLEEDFGQRFDEVEQRVRELNLHDPFNYVNHVVILYGHLHRYRLAASDSEREAAWPGLKRALRFGKAKLMSLPQFACHVLVAQACMARLQKKWDTAHRLCHEASVVARRCRSLWATYNALVEQARLAHDMDNPMARNAFATAARDLAVQQGWVPRLRALDKEFGVGVVQEEDGVRLDGAFKHASSEPLSGSSVRSSMGLQRGAEYLDVLLQVILASSSSVDADGQAGEALRELTRLLGAERALLFLVDRDSGDMRLAAAQNVGGEELGELRGYCTTIVERVRESCEALIVSGSEDAALMGSESAVVLGLRSIIAAPLVLRGDVYGVVYLDNRLASGFFTPAHVNVITGIGSHIAAALEMARAARIESENRALQRDMELTGSVQRLLLPAAQEYRGNFLQTATFYRPVTRCGGDWWWHDRMDGERTLLLLGDVSGHGAPAAMVGARIAGSYHTAREMGLVEPEELLDALQVGVVAMGGHYHMTMCILDLDSTSGEIRCWGAGTPPLLVWREGEKRTESVELRGMPLGMITEGEIGKASLQLEPGDRLLLFTDGLIEQETNRGRYVGMRRVAAMLKESANQPLSEARSYMWDQVEKLTSEVQQGDDITFILVERPAA